MKALLTSSLLLLISFLYTPLKAQVDYETEIQPIFNSNCVTCHGSSSGVTLSSYDAVMNSVGNQYGSNIVVPGAPDDSPLVDKIEPNPEFGSRMPQGGSLSDEEIQLIRTWISEGADEVPVSNERLAKIPDGFELVENYPNPFNPQTTVTFLSPQKASYQLYIYNAAGALIREISGFAQVPKTQVRVSLNDLPSGVYLYNVKVQTGQQAFFLKAKRMTLTK
ncbi:T9SS type A sorting domain-containing protein [Gracilimonas mengyeensis]|uniref:Por secretion system C-terminal sorting domain-containing protein n=1 Tax=Gracilimonas mengyeensis TaxID=1302730 RepID=A0A521AIH5_9BACT|nr:T9SS type A sorting domain-containing protein [Gracilimonas mengyeensis]SMO34612.1 Por secretion system C-terminal sorting domain-containing protein [Gracilimonas mengyeensis]